MEICDWAFIKSHIYTFPLIKNQASVNFITIKTKPARSILLTFSLLLLLFTILIFLSLLLCLNIKIYPSPMQRVFPSFCQN